VTPAVPFRNRQEPSPLGAWEMMRNPNLDMPLTAFMRAEIALPLRQVLEIYTVGGLLSAWHSRHGQKSIEELFDSPEQARQAVAVCASWVGQQTTLRTNVVPQWWVAEESAAKPQ
jgi:hypothetical protein